MVHGLSAKDTLQLDLKPFKTVYQRFKFRQTASYYLCWFTLNLNPILTIPLFQCNHTGLVNAFNQPIKYEPNDTTCSQLSFCPDICCANVYFSTKEKFQVHCWQHENNPCKRCI